VLIRIGAAAVEPLVIALNDKWRTVRGRAAEMLGKIGDARAVGPLLSKLEDKSEGERARGMAADALGKIGDARAVNPLLTALRDEDELVRRLAARALGQIGNARAVEPLLTALKDESQFVINIAADALKKLGVQTEKDDKRVHYSKKGQEARVLFSKQPLSRRTCPECRMVRREQNVLVVIGEADIPGNIKLKCPTCGHKAEFNPN